MLDSILKKEFNSIPKEKNMERITGIRNPSIINENEFLNKILRLDSFYQKIQINKQQKETIIENEIHLEKILEQVYQASYYNYIISKVKNDDFPKLACGISSKRVANFLINSGCSNVELGLFSYNEYYEHAVVLIQVNINGKKGFILTDPTADQFGKEEERNLTIFSFKRDYELNSIPLKYEKSFDPFELG